MINNFIMQKSDMIDLDKVENLNKLEEITTTILKSIEASKSPVKDTIEAIEKYNDDHKLPLWKRLDYWVTVDGNPTLLHAFHTIFRANFAEITCYITSGTIDAKFDGVNSFGQSRMTSSPQGFTTAIVPLDKLFGVSFGSYNTEIITPILENEKGDSTKITNIEILLRKELSTLNSLKSGGKLRDFIVEFSRFMNEDGVNDIKNYNYNREAYNLYTTLWTNYLNLVDNIVNHFETDVEKDPEIGLFGEIGKETVDNYKKILQ